MLPSDHRRAKFCTTSASWAWRGYWGSDTHNTRPPAQPGPTLRSHDCPCKVHEFAAIWLSVGHCDGDTGTIGLVFRNLPLSSISWHVRDRLQATCDFWKLPERIKNFSPLLQDSPPFTEFPPGCQRICQLNGCLDVFRVTNQICQNP